MAYHSDKKVYRDKKEGMVGGVCAGLSEYFKIDVTLIRIVMGVVSFFYGAGLVAYLVMWAVLPEKNY